MKPQLADSSLKVTVAMPNGAANVTTPSIDLGHSTAGDVPRETELLIKAPALAVGVLADAATCKYDVVTSASSDLSSPVTLAKEVLVQTGAGGAGAVAAEGRFRFATGTLRYVGVKATKSGNGDASGSTLTVQLVF